jgi:hypothetical protein
MSRLPTQVIALLGFAVLASWDCGTRFFSVDYTVSAHGGSQRV